MVRLPWRYDLMFVLNCFRKLMSACEVVSFLVSHNNAYQGPLSGKIYTYRVEERLQFLKFWSTRLNEINLCD